MFALDNNKIYQIPRKRKSIRFAQRRPLFTRQFYQDWGKYKQKILEAPTDLWRAWRSVYFYDVNNGNFKRYRNAYKKRLAGFTDDEFQGVIFDNNRLIDGMNFYKNTVIDRCCL